MIYAVKTSVSEYHKNGKSLAMQGFSFAFVVEWQTPRKYNFGSVRKMEYIRSPFAFFTKNHQRISF